MARSGDEERKTTLRQVIRERFGDPKTAELERPRGYVSPEEQEAHRRALAEAMAAKRRRIDRV